MYSNDITAMISNNSVHLRDQFETALEGNNAAKDMHFTEAEASFTPEADSSNELDAAGACEALDSEL